jgi:hypothetical protein
LCRVKNGRAKNKTWTERLARCRVNPDGTEEGVVSGGQERVEDYGGVISRNSE